MGGSLPLDQFDVTLSPDESARLLADRVNPGNVDRWSLLDLDPGPGYAAALAVENPLGRSRTMSGSVVGQSSSLAVGCRFVAF